MSFIKEFSKKEEGSATIEFLAIVPLMLLIMMIFWQMLVSGYGVIVAQSAANEAAKAYALSGNEVDAKDAAKQILGTSGNVKYVSATIPSHGASKNFTVTVDTKIDLVFIPKKIMNPPPSITFSRSVKGRVLD